MAKTRIYHKIDGWRGFSMPPGALVGSSDTGTWSDSPCPTPLVLAELKRFRVEVLKPLGIRSRQRTGSSSNVFCGKRYICVAPADYDRAIEPTRRWLGENRASTRFIFDCEPQKYRINDDGTRGAQVAA